MDISRRRFGKGVLVSIISATSISDGCASETLEALMSAVKKIRTPRRLTDGPLTDEDSERSELFPGLRQAFADKLFHYFSSELADCTGIVYSGAGEYEKFIEKLQEKYGFDRSHVLKDASVATYSPVELMGRTTDEESKLFLFPLFWHIGYSIEQMRSIAIHEAQHLADRRHGFNLGDYTVTHENIPRTSMGSYFNKTCAEVRAYYTQMRDTPDWSVWGDDARRHENRAREHIWELQFMFAQDDNQQMHRYAKDQLKLLPGVTIGHTKEDITFPILNKSF